MELDSINFTFLLVCGGIAILQMDLHVIYLGRTRALLNYGDSSIIIMMASKDEDG